MMYFLRCSSCSLCFFMIKEQPCVHLKPEEMDAIQEYYSFLQKKVKLKDNPFRKEITQGLILSLFYDDI